MDLGVGTIFVSPIVKSLIEKVSTYCSDEIALVWGVKGGLEKLSDTLELIDAVLHDAEKRQVENNRLVKLWLEKLKDVALDAEDILDELQYEDVRRKTKSESNILRLLPSKSFGFRYKIAHKIKDVNKKLDEITKNMKRFNFINYLGGSGSNGVMNENIPEKSSHISDSAAVVGRKNDISKILNLLIDSPDCSQESYSVVRITGMGGIGKTTLAQLVYADNMDHFQIKIWVSVSRKSNEREIFGELLESIGIDCQSSLNVTKDRLKEKLMVGKCLIVLDDVWTNHGIGVDELLKDLLSMSCEGSKILMTMRSTEDIPPMTDRRYIIYQLQGLPETDCWSIIKNIAFGHGGAKETTNLINIGKQIASKCGGLPLAAKTLGGLLYSRNDEEEWLSILNSQIWNLPAGENKIISLLKLSYDHLSPYVKRCFSYCSIFPKGHNINKKDLVLMWMAEGFLTSHSNASPETVGNEYFKIFLFNSFFHDESKNKSGVIKSCRMHDLVHDLAISIAGSECQKLTTDDDPVVIKQFKKSRCLVLQVLSHHHYSIPSEIYKTSKKLHTFISFCSGFYGIPGEPVWVKQIFSLSLLRVLTLCHPEIKELPQSICNLKNLRYLDLSFTAIETFPSSFSQLYNLQTLRLKGCQLKELPKDMRKMVGLEYFIFSEARLTQMPREVSRCIKLKGLSVFVVGTGKGYGIEELKDLNLLGGKLIIENLGSVTDATQANLIGKEKVMHLQLHWDLQRCDDDPSRTTKDTEVMNGLRPHKDLKKLKISRFVGSGFPTWMMSPSMHLPNLVTIQLYDCYNCEQLPALGRLRSLKYLRMERMRAIKQIGDEFHQSNEEPSFPFLVELYLCSFINLEEWFGDQRSSAASFSCLEMLEISDCSKLSTTPTIFPSLKRLDFAIKLVDDPNLKSLPLKLLRGANNVLQTLVVSDCNEFVGFLPDNGEEKQQHYQPDEPSNNYLSKIEILSCPSLTVLPADFRRLNALTYLAIKDCGSLKSLPNGIQYLPALQTLIIGGFSDDLDSFPFPAATGSDAERYFVSLRELTICGWPTLKDVLLDQLQHLTSLHRLNIKDFPGLLSLPEWFGELSSLRILDIENCRKLEYLPSEEKVLRLTSLQILNIRYSPLLLERCCFPNEEWHKIAHLKQVSRSSPSLFDHIHREADMNEELEARRRSGIFSNLNKEKCWMDSSGRNCLMLFPRGIYIAWKDNTRYWKWLSIIEPSASGDVEIEVPELVKVCWLTVHGKLEMSRLSPGVDYEIVFIVMFQEDSYGWDVPVDLWLELPDGQQKVQKVNLETVPKSQWIEIRVGDFKTPAQPSHQENEVNFVMREHDKLNWKKGLVIEGAIVRPKK